MFDLFDKAFWRFLSGFILIIVVSFSILVVSGVWKEAQQGYAALMSAFTEEP